jgi:hypothetical protein
VISKFFPISFPSSFKPYHSAIYGVLTPLEDIRDSRSAAMILIRGDSPVKGLAVGIRSWVDFRSLLVGFACFGAVVVESCEDEVEEGATGVKGV